MPAIDSFVGAGLNPSPYKEALAENERLRAALTRAEGLLLYVATSSARVLPDELYDAINAFLREREEKP